LTLAAVHGRIEGAKLIYNRWRALILLAVTPVDVDLILGPGDNPAITRGLGAVYRLGGLADDRRSTRVCLRGVDIQFAESGGRHVSPACNFHRSLRCGDCQYVVGRGRRGGSRHSSTFCHGILPCRGVPPGIQAHVHLVSGRSWARPRRIGRGDRRRQWNASPRQGIGRFGLLTVSLAKRRIPKAAEASRAAPM